MNKNSAHLNVRVLSDHSDGAVPLRLTLYVCTLNIYKHVRFCYKTKEMSVAKSNSPRFCKLTFKCIKPKQYT